MIKDIGSLVDLLVTENFVLEIYDGNVEDAKEQITFLCVESGLDYYEILEYLRSIHRIK